jgi:hypothetical protein
MARLGVPFSHGAELDRDDDDPVAVCSLAIQE